MKVLSAILVVVLVQNLAEAKVKLTKLENCDPNASYKVKLSIKFDSETGQIIEDGSLSTPVELGDNIMEIADVYTVQDGKYEHLVTIKETYCKALDKFLGEFFKDIQTAAGMKMGTCPIPPGDYKVNNHQLDFSKFKFKFPDGEFKIEVRLVEIKTNDTLNCHDIEFVMNGST